MAVKDLLIAVLYLYLDNLVIFAVFDVRCIVYDSLLLLSHIFVPPLSYIYYVSRFVLVYLHRAVLLRL